MIVEPGLLPLCMLFLLVLAVLTVPLSAAVFFSVLLLLFLNPVPPPPEFMYSYSLAMRLNSPALISIPLFALAGELAIASGITDRLLTVADILASGGRLSVGKRIVTGCTLFAMVSGVGQESVTEEGKRLMPEMLRVGYDAPSAAGALASAAGISIIIPASIPLTIYAATVGIQTNIVFTASFLPGLLVAALLTASVVIYERVHRCDEGIAPPPAGERWGIVWEAKWSLGLPVCVLAALFTGFFTAPEAAAFASAYAYCVGRFLHRKLDGAAVRGAFARAAVSASTVLLIAGVGGLAMRLLETCGFPDRLGMFFYQLGGGRAGSIFLINVVLLVAGCFIDMPAIITLVVPLFLPLAVLCGMTLPQYGVMVVVNIAIGLVTPPQAYNIRAAARQAGIGMRQAAKGTVPFLLAMLISLGLLSYFPRISLFLPGLFGWLE